jgi:hypothetical protein
VNRKQRRELTKGDKNSQIQKIAEADRALKQQAMNIDKCIVDKGKEFASAVVQTEFMAIARDTLHTDLKATDEQIAIFEEKFKERFTKRLEGLGNDNENKEDDATPKAENTSAEEADKQ